MKKTIFTLLIIHCSFIITNAQWHPQGPYGGTVYCYTKSGLTLFAGTDRGIFLSTDNGIS